MNVYDDPAEERRILKKDPYLVVILFLGVIFVVIGCVIIPSPDSQWGFPSFALGVTFAFFGINRYFNIKSAEKIDEINKKLERLKVIENLLRNGHQHHNITYGNNFRYKFKVRPTNKRDNQKQMSGGVLVGLFLAIIALYYPAILDIFIHQSDIGPYVSAFLISIIFAGIATAVIAYVAEKNNLE